MTNHLILSKIKEESLLNWNQINNEIPYTEIEILRALDQIIVEPDQLSDQAVSTLRVMLAFHRLVRQHDTDELAEKLLLEANATDKHGLSQQLQAIKDFQYVIDELHKLDLQSWVIREADYASAKLNKMQDWQPKLQHVLVNFNMVFRQEPKEFQQLSTIFNRLKINMTTLNDLMEDGIAMLQNKRSGIPIKEINQIIKAILADKEAFIEAIPNTFSKNQKQNPLQKLEEMVGLEQVKQYIKQYYHYLKYQQDRKKIGFQMIDEPGLHMIITGNPGTGKTTIARLLAEIYHELGLLESKQVIEVNRSHLVGSYVGQSEENTINFIREAVGGVLFIDEAYSLHRPDASGSDYGQAVIDTLVSAMTSGEYANKFAVILAGYPEEMRQFLWSNPGLRSRFPEQNMIALPDFKIQELVEIAEATALDNDYFFTETALNSFYGLIERAKVDDTFGNARTVRDLVMKAIFKKGASITVQAEDNWLDHMRIESKDLAVMEDEKDDTAPMDQLEQLIGLDNIKNEVKKLSSFVKIQQSRKNQGYPSVPIQLHAVFSGNPGTGKTTVAKIYSKLLKECGLLKRGHFVLASRSDLVAGYVGQTAIKTKNKIREALGGVLFIDEAYALFRGENDFGKEAIDTLVDEMTKHNENLVVILAGYRQDMERFISSNPGLASRFKKYFEFLDYQADELMEITKYHVSHYHYQITASATDYVHQQYRDQKLQGNARFVVNLVEEAIQFQAMRIAEQSENNEPFLELNKTDFIKAWQAVRGE
ncbi:AAA+-type ATPase, SpoVK/Ycf46/Vps4 family [Amphibacillus marinus]|uniref:AAA+-type ATPase, SpoVK/Ycf46/Vps4 family n=1 Tax=Amphibacillus marinus TaxID=872970 RepID=A0A1H8GWZ5_9BACI|nr:AAA family ATPase [Amphibacillus marinus]SEN48592.1 AAA+-type ATPase, SpoVK/Ycf46/Vps4 family [Amphibacillus marinus]